MPTVQDIRNAMPEMHGLTDQQVVRVLHQLDYPDLPQEQVAKALGVDMGEPAPAPEAGAEQIAPPPGIDTWAIIRGVLASFEDDDLMAVSQLYAEIRLGGASIFEARNQFAFALTLLGQDGLIEILSAWLRAALGCLAAERQTHAACCTNPEHEAIEPVLH